MCIKVYSKRINKKGEYEGSKRRVFEGGGGSQQTGQAKKDLVVRSGVEVHLTTSAMTVRPSQVRLWY
jgi:hypothetical protein